MAKETRLWRLVEQWIDAQRFPPSQAKIAEAVGVKPTAFSQWKLGHTQPKPEHLRKLAEVTGIEYRLLLAAVNADTGYLRDEELPEGGQQGWVAPGSPEDTTTDAGGASVTSLANPYLQDQAAQSGRQSQAEFDDDHESEHP